VVVLNGSHSRCHYQTAGPESLKIPHISQAGRRRVMRAVRPDAAPLAKACRSAEIDRIEDILETLTRPAPCWTENRSPLSPKENFGSVDG